ncbi:MAG: hypothetical protein GTN49_04720 [candidate division Zixibacteria bacterium]|nr:hypothetical protein [candidate division Zixibacteria bacterium]
MTTDKRYWRRVVWTAAKIIIVAGALFFVGKVLVENWPDVRAGWRAPRPLPALAATAALFASYVALFKISLAVLRRVGYRLGFRAGLRPFFYTLLGRYVPGRFAVILGKVYMYEKRGVPRLSAGLAVAYENIFAAVGGVAIALAASATILSGTFSWGALAPAAGGAVAFAVLIHPKVLRPLLAWAARKTRLGELGPGTLLGRGRSVAFALAYAGYCISLGVFFALFAAAFVSVDLNVALRAGGAYVAAAVLGYVAVFAPSGLGVREGLLVILLQRYMPVGEAAFLAIASRVAAVAAELVLAAIAASAGKDPPAIAARGRSAEAGKF